MPLQKYLGGGGCLTLLVDCLISTCVATIIVGLWKKFAVVGLRMASPLLRTLFWSLFPARSSNCSHLVLFPKTGKGLGQQPHEKRKVNWQLTQRLPLCQKHNCVQTRTKSELKRTIDTRPRASIALQLRFWVQFY